MSLSLSSPYARFKMRYSENSREHKQAQELHMPGAIGSRTCRQVLDSFIDRVPPASRGDLCRASGARRRRDPRIREPLCPSLVFRAFRAALYANALRPVFFFEPQAHGIVL